MAMSYDEVLNVWGRKLLADRGYKVSAEAVVQVSVVVESSGGCSTCSFDEAVVEVCVGKSRYMFYDYEFKEILLELVAVAKGS